MQNWKKSRNYRRIYNENGVFIANIITVDGQDVAVNEEVFAAYSQMDRRERYVMEENTDGQALSWNQLQEDGVLPSYIGMESAPSAEDCCMEHFDNAQTASMLEQLRIGVATLPEKDRALIAALFFDGLSIRAYAAQTGVTPTAIFKRKNCVLQKMKKYFNTTKN